MEFKRGEVYKALFTLYKPDPDWIEAPTILFEKDRIYRCRKDGTLYSYGSFHNEDISDENKERFELVGHFYSQKTEKELIKEAMRQAFIDDIFYKTNDFENFYKSYEEYLEKLRTENDEIDEDKIHYIDGQEGAYWNNHMISKSLI